MSEKIDDMKQVIDRLVLAEKCAEDGQLALNIARDALELIASDTFGFGNKTGLSAQNIAKQALEALNK